MIPHESATWSSVIPRDKSIFYHLLPVHPALSKTPGGMLLFFLFALASADTHYL